MTTRQAQLERLFKEHHEALLRYVRSRAPHVADDVVAETFVVAVRRTDAIPADAELPWLLGVAKNVIRDHARAERRAARFIAESAQGTPQSAPGPEPASVGPAMNDLPPTERAVLTLTGVGGFSSAEAAEQLGMSAGSVRNAMMRGRRALAIQLGGAAALLILGLLTLLLHDRASDGRTAAQQLADSLTKNAVLRARVEATGAGRGGLYTLAADLRRGTQEFGLGNGIVQRGAIGGSLRASAPAQTPQTDVDRRVADAAPVIRALRTLTEGQVQRVLDRASRGELPIARRGDVDVITSRVNSYDGPIVTLRITIDHERGTLRRVAVRSEGQWTTLTFRNLRFTPPAADPPPSSPSTDRPAGAAVERRSAIRTAVQRLDPKTGIPWPRGMDDSEAARNRDRVVALPAFTGETHSIVYTRSEHRVQAGAAPVRSVREWRERGGGQRIHTISSRRLPDGREVPERERWASPVMVAERTWTVDGQPEPMTVTISCAARQEGFAWVQRPTVRFSALHAEGDMRRGRPGDRIRGERTRTGQLPFFQYLPDGSIETAWSDPRDPSRRLTGWRVGNMLLRSVERWRVSRRERDRGETGYLQIDYLHARRAGRDARTLTPTLPDRFTLRRAGCTDDASVAAAMTARGVPPRAPEGYLPMVDRY